MKFHVFRCSVNRTSLSLSIYIYIYIYIYICAGVTIAWEDNCNKFYTSLHSDVSSLESYHLFIKK